MFPFILALRATVAADAIVDVGNALLAMLRDDLRGLMFVAAVAGVPLVVAAGMASRTGGIVMTVELEVAGVIECRRFPMGRLMARCAWHRLSTMELVEWCLVAVLAPGAGISLQKCVIK